jgi:hypothetical protein
MTTRIGRYALGLRSPFPHEDPIVLSRYMTEESAREAARKILELGVDEVLILEQLWKTVGKESKTLGKV